MGAALLGGCPWIPKPDTDDSDTDHVCDDSDADGLCDEDDLCPFANNDDSHDGTALIGGTVTGSTCGGADYIVIPEVQAGCTYDVDLSFEHANGDLSLEVANHEGQSASSDNQSDFEHAAVVSTLNDTLDVTVDGAVNDYSLTVSETCPACLTRDREPMQWGTSVSGTLCPGVHEASFTLAETLVNCDQGFQLNNGVGQWAHLRVTGPNGASNDLSGDQGSLSLVGAIANGDGTLLVELSQVSGSDTTQGFWLSAEQYCR